MIVSVAATNTSKRVKALRDVISHEKEAAAKWSYLGMPEYAAMSLNKADHAREVLEGLGGKVSE